MRSYLLFIVLNTLCCSVYATADINHKYCVDSKTTQEFTKLLTDHPQDTGIVRLVALKEGLCSMINQHQVSLHTANQLWDSERQKMFLERTKRNLNRFSE
ncbi:MAG: hypothetical protein D4R63_09575 [Methylococcaceae bacterium]|jgi:hypothetical protein|nr:MAG: hypothetical protein D4R63_09575 [Methylococcaceae bacterium]